MSIRAIKNIQKGVTNIKKILFLLFFIFYAEQANSQCAMCRAALNNQANQKKAEAVNDGIVYLMIIPYVLVAGIAYAVYRMKKQK